MIWIYKYIFFVVFIILANDILCQSFVLKGTVTGSDTGDKLHGASIIIKGTHNGTLTNEKGKYAIETNIGEVIVFSFPGYKKLEITVSAKIHNVTLIFDETVKQEILNLGYFELNKLSSSLIVDNKSFTNFQNNIECNFGLSLQGLFPGIEVSKSNGSPNSSYIINLRGPNSIISDCSPLIIVDGVPVVQKFSSFSDNEIFDFAGINPDPFSFINNSDIQEIITLKGTASCSIFGVRGSNGVILISTKKANNQSNGFKADYTLFFQSSLNRYNLLNTSEYVYLYKEAAKNDLVNYTTNAETLVLPGGYSIENIKQNTDWQDYIFHTGVGNLFNLDYSFSNDTFKIYSSFNIKNSDGILKPSSTKDVSLRLNSQIKANENLKFNLNTQFFHQSSQFSPVSSTGGLGTAITTALPYFPVYDNSTKSGFAIIKSKNDSIILNPVNQIYNDTYFFTQNRLFLNCSSEIIISNNHKLIWNEGFEYVSNDFTNQQNEYIVKNQYFNYKISKSINFCSNLQSILNLKISRVLNVEFLSGCEVIWHNVSRDIKEEIPGLRVSNNLQLPDYQLNYSSIFEKIGIKYKESYLVDFILRADAGSMWYGKNKIALFPAASFSWIVSNEKFLKNNIYINYFKISSGLGSSGNSSINPDIKRKVLQSKPDSNDAYLLNNPNFKPESTIGIEANLELGVFNNRLFCSVNVFKEFSRNLLLEISNPSSSGVDYSVLNIGRLNNSGIELQFSAANRIGRYKWLSGGNLTFQRNEVLNINRASDAMINGKGGVSLKEDYPLSSFRLIKFAYINPDNGKPLYYNSKEKLLQDWPDNQDVDENRVYLGNQIPKIFGNFFNSLYYRGFELNCNLYFCLGYIIYDLSDNKHFSDISNWNLKREAINRWSAENHNTSVSRLTLKDNIDGVPLNRKSSEFLHNGNYLKISNLSLGYFFPEAYISKLKLKSLKIYLGAENLYYFTKYKGINPETTSYKTSWKQVNQEQHVNYLSVPQARTFYFKFTFSF